LLLLFLLLLLLHLRYRKLLLHVLVSLEVVRKERIIVAVAAVGVRTPFHAFPAPIFPLGLLGLVATVVPVAVAFAVAVADFLAEAPLSEIVVVVVARLSLL
jgi:hypothetical protein